MAQTHTSLLRRFGYHKTRIRRMAGLFHETEGIRYFEHARGYLVALRSNGAWRHCGPDGKRIGEKQTTNEFHGVDKLEIQLTRIHGACK